VLPLLVEAGEHPAHLIGSHRTRVTIDAAATGRL
jgi:hypothetical protein